MSYDRAEHLADVNRDIQNWQAEAKRLELEGHTSRADAVRGWIRSAKHGNPDRLRVTGQVGRRQALATVLHSD